MGRKKIIFVVPDMAGGGTEKVISLLADEYVREGMDVGILLFAGKEVAYPLDGRVEVYSAGEPSGGSLSVRIKRLRNMREYFCKNPEALIFSFSTIGTGFIVLSVLDEFLSGKRKMLVSERTDPQTCSHKPYRNFFYRFCKVLVCQTKEAVGCFPRRLSKKAVVVANPMDPKLPDVYEGCRSKRIVTVGRLQPVKNQKMLLEAYAAFEKECPDYTLHLYGKGDLEEELKAQAIRLGLREKIVFHGFSRQVAEDIRDAAMFVLCSDYEGVSNSLGEALALGIPSIATDCPIGGCRSYITHGVNGLLTPVGGQEELTDAMRRIAKEEGLADSLSKEARKVRERFCVERIAGAMYKALEERTVGKGGVCSDEDNNDTYADL